jgi:hypothetical protein
MECNNDKEARKREIAEMVKRLDDQEPLNKKNEQLYYSINKVLIEIENLNQEDLPNALKIEVISSLEGISQRFRQDDTKSVEELENLLREYTVYEFSNNILFR